VPREEAFLMSESCSDSITFPLALAIDIGTSSVRSMLFDRQGSALQNTVQQIPFDLTTTSDGGATLDPEVLLECAIRCVDGTLREAGDLAAQVRVAGISCFWHSLLGLDELGRPTTPVYLWADTRSAREVELLRDSFDERAIHQRTGCVFHSSYWPAKLRWLCSEAPKTFERTRRWCAFSDYLLRRITGADVTSVSMASGTGVLDIRGGFWDEGVAEIAGIVPSTLPRIVSDGELVTGLAPEFATRWSSLADVPWLPGLGDGACANVGSGAVGNDRIALSLGTTGAMRIVLERALGATMIIPEGLWAYRLDHKRIVLGAAISNGGKVLAWLNDLLKTSYGDAVMQQAMALEPDAHGLTVLPFLAGERSPIWNDRATAVVAGVTLNTGRAELLRAGMEAVGLRFARLYEALRTVAAKEHEIVASGAAILNSPVWLQITADCLWHPLLAPPPSEEASARGAAIMALLGIGAISNLGDVADPADGALLVGSSRAAELAYQRALRRQTLLESLLFPNGTSWDAEFDER
jgi:gluconokinase